MMGSLCQGVLSPPRLPVSTPRFFPTDPQMGKTWGFYGDLTNDIKEFILNALIHIHPQMGINLNASIFPRQPLFPFQH